MVMMVALLACGVALPAPELPSHQVFASSEEALQFVLASKPKIIGIGEVHATVDGPGGRTTLGLFTRRLLPLLAPQTTDLVIETWRLDGTCGEQAERVVAQVRADTRRPVETKSELALLVEASAALGVRPHDLVLTCDEYAAVTQPDGSISYDGLLRLLAGKLGEFAQRGLDTPDATLVLYGGAVHNDRAPRADLAAYSYGAAAAARGGEAYVELDLYAPERVRGNPLLVEPAWAALLDHTGPDRALLFARGPGSWVLLLEEPVLTAPATSPPAPAPASPASTPE